MGRKTQWQKANTYRQTDIQMNCGRVKCKCNNRRTCYAILDQRMNEQQCIPGILRKPTQTQKHTTCKHKNIQSTNTQMQKQTQKHKDTKRKTQNALKKRMNWSHPLVATNNCCQKKDNLIDLLSLELQLRFLETLFLNDIIIKPLLDSFFSKKKPTFFQVAQWVT